MPIEYSEYKSLIDILESTTNDNSSAYEDLMSKEKNVLSTINHVVKHINDKDINSQEFISTSIQDIFYRLFIILPDIANDLIRTKNISEIIQSLTKDDRIIYIGVIMILISIFMFFIYIL
jgi:hypothetical protein